MLRSCAALLVRILLKRRNKGEEMAENVECMRRRETPTGVSCGNLKERDH
jgi:hypothetical protein